MKGQMAVGYICDFKEGEGRECNQVIGLPGYLSQIANGSDNPVREFLSTVQPGCRVSVMIVVEAIPRAK